MNKRLICAFRFNREIQETNDSRILEKYSGIKRLCCQMIEKSERNLRPSCHDILEKIKSLMISSNEINDEVKIFLHRLGVNDRNINLENLKFHEILLLKKFKSI